MKFKFLITTLVLLTSLTTFFLFGVTIFAQTNKPVSYDNKNTSLDIVRVFGTVLKVDTSQIYLQAQGDIHQVPVNNNIKVLRNGTKSQLNDINQYDRVLLTVTQTGQILTINAVDGQLVDIAEVILPAIALILIVFGLYIIIRNQTKRGYIKTKTTRINY